MTSTTNIFRRGAVYYLRRRIRWRSGAIHSISVSLKTRSLPVARTLAIELSATCERMRSDFDATMPQHSLSQAERARIFNRQLTIERDQLHALHVDMISNGDARRGQDFHDSLDVMETVSSHWATMRLPSADRITRDGGLERYIAINFPGLSEADQWELGMSLGGSEIIEYYLEEGAEAALQLIGADATDRSRAAAIMEIMAAKSVAARWVREELAYFEKKHSVVDPPPDPSAASWPEFEHIEREPLFQLLNVGAPVQAYCPAQPTSPIEQAAAGQNIAELTLEAAGEAFLVAMPKIAGDREASKWNAKTKKQFRTAVMLAGKAIPGPVGTITHNDILYLSKLFGRLPDTHHKTPRHKTMNLEQIANEAEQAVARGEMRSDQIGLDGGTTNRHLRFLRQLLNWVGRTVSLAAIYWEDFLVSDHRDHREDRRQLSIAQGNALFRLPIWTGCASAARRHRPGPYVFQDSAYWVPMLLWYTGARRQEVCKLHCDDVVQENNIWYIAIKTTDSGGLKNSVSRRDIPVHSELIRLRFIDYVETIRGRGHVLLFPDLVTKSSPLGDVWFKRNWPQFRKALVLPADQCAHSIRHMVCSELKKQGEQPDAISDLLGHAHSGETFGRYSERARAVELVDTEARIPNVTAHLQPLPICLPVREKRLKSRADRRQGSIENLIAASQAPNARAQPKIESSSMRLRAGPRLIWNIDD